ncbi:MAG TPA: polyphosphate kinase 1 [Anaeromyxobacter sp.]|nr:polyphosphate kinase 1 [Anaeromyxobacter sp.]
MSTAVPASELPAKPLELPEKRPAPGPETLRDPRLYVNRELSLLAFQERVLEEALDPGNPLLERVRFLAIVASNLDEFFMIRVAALRQQLAAGVGEVAPDGMGPQEILAAIRRKVAELRRTMSACLHGELLPALAAAGVHVLDYPQLSDEQRAQARRYFDEFIFPVLTPLAVDPGRPFPHISNLSLNLAVLIQGADAGVRFARVKVPDTLPRLVPVGRGRSATPVQQHLVWIEQVVAAHVDALFPGTRVLEVHPFHVTRDAEILLQEAEADDLLETIEQGVRQRRFGSVVRLKVGANMTPNMRDLLVENLDIQPSDVYQSEPPLGLAGLSALAAVDRRDLKFPPFQPAIPARLSLAEDEDLFAAIRRQDVLLHHPYDSFGPVVDFLRAAARDPDVLAIKMTLYRVGRNSPVVEALLEASQAGKQVAVLVELKARFDEESNIGWARTLEAEGVHVIYGLLGLKTHSKVALVVRREGNALRRYVHLSTGNYNGVTASVYTDLGFFTCDPDFGDDATHLFNTLTGYSAQEEYRKLLVAPARLRERLLALIDREIDHQRAGRGGHLVFKVNALVDRAMMEALLRASAAGVRIDLVVRGICSLRPALAGRSETVQVRSVVGRFLEHSRIFWFRNGGDEEVYLGSADLMERNLDRRVEVVFPVGDPQLLRTLRDEILESYLRDNVRTRLMQPDGSYRRLHPAEGEAPYDSQLAPLQTRATKKHG